MKKAGLFVLRYISVTAAFFAAAAVIFLLLMMFGIDKSLVEKSLVFQVLIISVIYAATSPISFSVRHFVSLSMTSRLLIQTVVNYPILVICGTDFGWISSFNSFCTVTTAYFFTGLAASIFICVYYPYKYKLYNDRLKAYKKKALLEDYPK